MTSAHGRNHGRRASAGGQRAFSVGFLKDDRLVSLRFIGLRESDRDIDDGLPTVFCIELKNFVHHARHDVSCRQAADISEHGREPARCFHVSGQVLGHEVGGIRSPAMIVIDIPLVRFRLVDNPFRVIRWRRRKGVYLEDHCQLTVRHCPGRRVRKGVV